MQYFPSANNGMARRKHPLPLAFGEWRFEVFENQGKPDNKTFDFQTHTAKRMQQPPQTCDHAIMAKADIHPGQTSQNCQQARSLQIGLSDTFVGWRPGKVKKSLTRGVERKYQPQGQQQPAGTAGITQPTRCRSRRPHEDNGAKQRQPGVTHKLDTKYGS